MESKADLSAAIHGGGHDHLDEVSMSRQQEMKKQHDSQQEFHSLLKEYMGKKRPRKLKHHLRCREAIEEKGILHIPSSLFSIVRGGGLFLNGYVGS